MSKLPSEDLKALRFFIQRVGMIAGVEMPDRSQFHPRFLIVLLISVLAEIMHFTGICDVWPNFQSLCISFVIYSLIIQQLTRFINRNILNDEDRIKNLQDLMLQFYKREETNSNLIPILKSGVEKTRLVLQIYMTISLVVYHIPVMTSWVISYVSGQYETFAQMRLPYTNLNNLAGFIVNNSLATLISALMYLLFMLQDMVFIYHTYQILPMVDILTRKLHLLGIKLIDCKKSYHLEHKKFIEFIEINRKQHAHLKLQVLKVKIEIMESKLTQIIKDYETYNIYIKKMVDSYHYTAFMALSMNSAALGLTIIIIRFVSIPVGSAGTAILLFQVLLPCVNGNLINKQNEKLLRAVYEFPWYELSINKRKMYLQFYLVCQNPSQLILPIIGKVDLELFTRFVNTSYSYLMLLLKFVKN